jgi:hypothetical protein
MTDVTQTEPQIEEPPASPAKPSPDARQAGLTVILAILVYFAFDCLLPLIRLPEHWRGAVATTVGLVVPTVIFMLLQLWLAKTVVGLRWPPVPALLGAVASIGMWFVIAWFLHISRTMSLPEIRALLLLKSASLSLLLTLGLTFFGVLLALIIREPNVLLPIALIAMPIDYVGAMTSLGFTQAMVQHAPQIVSAVSVAVPSMGTARGGIGVHPIGFIGPGDALFIACFLAAVQRLGLNERGTFWWIYGLLTLTMLVVLIKGFPIAALVPMGLAVILANFRSFRYQRSEVFAMIYAAIMIFVVVGAFYVASHHFLFRRR